MEHIAVTKKIKSKEDVAKLLNEMFLLVEKETENVDGYILTISIDKPY